MNGETRVGDAEREQAASALAEHYAAGRLDHAEYSERLDAIWTARTRGDLGIVFHDLPLLTLPTPAPAPRRRRGRLPLPVAALLVLVVGALVITHLPVVVLVVGAVLLVKIVSHRGAGPRHWQGDRPTRRW